jgi:acetyl esterase
MRKYAKQLLDQIHAKEHVETVDGVPVLMKPVPDDDRPHVLDPRLLDVIRMKRKMFAQRAQKGYRLSQERYRPDKVTEDLCTVEIDVDEKLIDIGHDHKIDIYLYRRHADQGCLPVLIYLHGGGMTAGDMRLFANQMRLIAELAQAVVVFPEYRLAPECPYPASIEDAWGTVQWVAEHADELNVDLNRLMVAGDSAGGALTNACLLKDENGLIKKAFEIYPAVDSTDYRKQTRYSWSYDAYLIVEEQREDVFSRIDRIKNSAGVSEAESLYLQGKTNYENPLVSVIYAPAERLAQFPPLTIVSAEYDYLRVGSDYFVKLLRDLGVDVNSVRYCGCDHGFLDLLGTIVQAEDLCHLIAGEIRTMAK